MGDNMKYTKSAGGVVVNSNGKILVVNQKGISKKMKRLLMPPKEKFMRNQASGIWNSLKNWAPIKGTRFH